MTEAWLEEWIKKADEDYLAASSLNPSTVPAVICFLCQQCVEKYLKAALVKYGAHGRKTHDLVVLNALIAQHDRRFEEFDEHLIILNPYSVIVRYPGAETTPQDARQALKAAAVLRERIRRLLDLEMGK